MAANAGRPEGAQDEKPAVLIIGGLGTWNSSIPSPFPFYPYLDLRLRITPSTAAVTHEEVFRKPPARR